MDIKELNKRQLILLTLLVTFVVSIATGIITVSLMQQAPKSVPQTINNVIQRTIEKVTTVPTPTPAKTTTENTTDTKGVFVAAGDADLMISIYPLDAPKQATSTNTLPVIPPPPATPVEQPKALGEGIIISDVGLIMVDSSILTDAKVYKVILNQTDFEATILKKFGNGFTILKIRQKQPSAASATDAGEVKGASTTVTGAPIDTKK